MRPRHFTVPEVGFKIPETIFKRVLLPTPFRPMTATASPRLMEKLMFFKQTNFSRFKSPLKARTTSSLSESTPTSYFVNFIVTFLISSRQFSCIGSFLLMRTSQFCGDFVAHGEQEQRTERIVKYADMFRIRDELGKLISSYSHGMKQKLAIIGALVHAPRLLILDEPFVGLDPEAAFKLKNVFKEMCENGSAIFFSTHVLDVAEKLCNKIAIIKQGKLVACGPTEQVRGDESLETVFMEVLESNDK